MTQPPTTQENGDVETTKSQSSIPFAQFLEDFPLNTVQVVSGFYEKIGAHAPRKLAPQLRLWCEGDACSGYRHFDGEWGSLYGVNPDTWTLSFINYTCRNCSRITRAYCLRSLALPAGSASLMKLGEIPELHIQIPTFLYSMLGDDSSYFVKGLKSEKAGCGIGAFSYYRRVVENQKGRLIDHIAKVANRLGASESELTKFEELKKTLDYASSETQFSKAVKEVRLLIPQSILIDGHNPLLALHTALSIGLHETDDDQCLRIAHGIRILLQELARRMKEALRDDAEVKKALADVFAFNRGDRMT